MKVHRIAPCAQVPKEKKVQKSAKKPLDSFGGKSLPSLSFSLISHVGKAMPMAVERHFDVQRY